MAKLLIPNSSVGVGQGSLYMWIKYADDSTGKGMTVESDGKKYIGVAYNRVAEEPSDNPEDYEWTKFEGEKGDKGDTGAAGAKGEKGDPFTYEDFTPEQLSSLKGVKGDKGDIGATGSKGEKGDTGATGVKGEKGDSITGITLTKDESGAITGGVANLSNGEELAIMINIEVAE